MEFDGDLCRFDVWFAGEFLGSVYPSDRIEMQACIDRLDAGLDPVTGNRMGTFAVGLESKTIII